MKQKRNLKIDSIKNSLSSFSVIRAKSDLIAKKIVEKQNKVNTLNTLNINSESDLNSSSYQASEDNQQDQSNSFLEKYDLEKKIGEGANGTVYRCLHKKSKKEYAVKVFSMDHEHVRELKKNFLFMKELKNIGIIKYKALYFDHQKRTTYLVMDYLPYCNLLEAKISEEKELQSIVRLLLDAIQYIHNRSISHRDIKPENILYDHFTKRIKLIDFGISKKTYLRGERRDMLTIIGTSFYIAPEIYLGGGYDERVDLWALGVTVYKLITGITPFESEYHSDTIQNILKGEVKFDETIWKKYSPFAKDFVHRLLKPKDQRISIKNAKRHLWLMMIEKQEPAITQSFRLKYKNSGKITRNHQTYNHEIDEIFHHQINQVRRHASSKEEGDGGLKVNEQFEDEQNQEADPLSNNGLLKVMQLMQNDEFDLIDSDDEEVYVSSRGGTPSPEKLDHFNRARSWSQFVQKKQ